MVSDGKGNIYFVDHDLATRISALRKISSSAQVSTLTQFPADSVRDRTDSTYTPLMALAMDPEGNFYVTDRSTVSKIALDGKVTLIAGMSGQVGLQDGVGAAARFNFPSGIAVDTDGTLYIADTGNNAIRKIDPSGKVTTVAGGTGEGNRLGPLPGALRHPKGIALVSPKTLVVSVADCVLRIVMP
jgi:streptogramin lyase